MAQRTKNAKAPYKYDIIEDIISDIEDLNESSGGGGDSLPTTGGNLTGNLGTQDVTVAQGKAVKSANGGGQLNLDIDEGTDEVMLSTDGGQWGGTYLYMTPYGAEFYVPNPGSGTNNLLMYAGTQHISIDTGVSDKIDIKTPVLTLTSLPTYADNAAAVSGGLPLNGVYKTATGELRIRV